MIVELGLASHIVTIYREDCLESLVIVEWALHETPVLRRIELLLGRAAPACGRGNASLDGCGIHIDGFSAVFSIKLPFLNVL